MAVSIFKNLCLNLMFVVLAALKSIKVTTYRIIYSFFLLQYRKVPTGMSGNLMSGGPMWLGKGGFIDIDTNLENTHV